MVEKEEEESNVVELLVGLSRFKPGSAGDTVVFSPRIPRRNQDAFREESE